MISSLSPGQPNRKISSRDTQHSGGSADLGSQVVRVLQYEVREGGEAGEVVVVPTAFIANRNSSFILLEVLNEVSVHAGRSDGPEEQFGEG